MEAKEVKIFVKDPISQEEKVLERRISPLTWKRIEELLESQDIVPKEKVIYAIQNLNIPAEAKAILVKIADFTITVGNRVLSIGKRILEIILYLIREYPNTTIGVIVGASIGFAIDMIPVIGWIFGPIIKPLCIALGFAVGFWRDMKDKSLKEKTEREITNQFGVLKDIEEN